MSATPEQIADVLDQIVDPIAPAVDVLTEDRTIRAAAALIRKQAKNIKKLETLLIACAEFIEPYIDVSDGAYGEPAPNAAMSLLSAINEEIT